MRGAIVYAASAGLGLRAVRELYLRLCGVRDALELPLSGQRHARRALLGAAVGLAAFGLAVLPMLPQSGLRSRLSAVNGDVFGERIAEPGILPVNWLDAANIFEPLTIEQHGWIHIPASGSPQLQFSISHGDAVLEIGGKEAARIGGEPPLPVQVISLDGMQGVREITLRAAFDGPVPQAGLRMTGPGGGAALDWRLHFSTERTHGLRWLLALRGILGLCLGAAAVLALASAGIRFDAWMDRRPVSRIPAWQAAPVILAALLASVCFRAMVIERSGGVLDADEAAFGIMADRILEGEFPPLYHYGQNYQGTIEAWTMAMLFQMTGVSAAVLHWHPFLWYLLGGAVLMALSARDVRLGVLCALGGYLAISPQLLTWISTKAWFGYDSTWAMGAGTLLVAVWIARQPEGGLWRWALWGALAGLAFYTLPLVAPFLLVSGIVVARPAWRTLYGRGGVAFAVGLIAGLTPMLLYDLATGGQAWRFVLHGRELGQARQPGELPFFDRFLGECLPVLLGTRPVHEDRFEHVHRAAAMGVYTLFWLGCVGMAPRWWRGAREFWRKGAPSAVFIFGLLAMASTFIGVRAQFGIWPWYFIAVYPFLVLILYEGVRCFSCVMPMAGPVLWLLIVGVNAYGSLQAAPVMHQPTSLLKQGVPLANDHTGLLKILEERGIHSLICDQGMDFTSTDPGRDWLGERITFESRGTVNAVDRFSRRHAHLAWRLHHAPRIAYLFHRKLLWWDADPTRVGETDKFSMTFQKSARLLGPDFANYERVDIPPYALFLPRAGSIAEEKNQLSVIASKSPHLTERILDGGIGSRNLSLAYWATGYGGQEPGDFIEVDLKRERNVSALVLYHGIKGYDRSGKARVELAVGEEPWRHAGYLDWHANPNASVWRIAGATAADRIRVTLEEARPDTWWTVYEAWAVE